MIGVLLIAVSCKHPSQKKVDPGISAQGQKILNTTETLAYYGNAGKAIVYLDSAFRTLKNPSAIELFEKYKDKSQYYTFTKKDVLKASIYTDSMLYSLKGFEKQYGAEYAGALFAKGDAILLRNGYFKAFQYYYDAQQFALNNLDSCKSYGFTYRLGLVRYKQERYKDAIVYIKQAYNQGEHCDDNATVDDMWLSRRNFLNTLGICFERIGKLDSANFYYKKQLLFLKRYSDEVKEKKKEFILTARGVAYGNIGGVYAKLGKFKEAEKYLKQSIQINEIRPFAQTDALTAKLKLAGLYFQFKDFKQTGVLLDQLQIALEEKKPEREMQVETQLKLYKLQWEFFGQTNNLPKAYKQVQLYYHLRDSLDKVNHSLKIADVDLIFKNAEQHYKLSLLSKQNEVKKGYLITFIIFSCMATIMLFALWRNRKKLKLLNAKMMIQNADMQKVLSALEQSQAENKRMLKIVAHDLRSPIAAAISIAGMLKSASTSPEDREMLDLLETSSLHSLEMITDLLNINISAESLVKEPVALHSLVRYCVNLLRFKADDKKQQLKLSTIDAIIPANREKIWRVISNLIVNAIKFSPVGSEIEISMYKNSNEAVVMILDHGIGIPVDLHEKIFDIFTDAKRKGTSGEHSFGLGLAISKQIVEAHGGKIWLESQVDGGSSFFVALPMGN